VDKGRNCKANRSITCHWRLVVLSVTTNNSDLLRKDKVMTKFHSLDLCVCVTETTRMIKLPRSDILTKAIFIRGILFFIIHMTG
jgi:hypothetical protein